MAEYEQLWALFSRPMGAVVLWHCFHMWPVPCLSNTCPLPGA